MAGAATASAQKERICSEELGISISINGVFTCFYLMEDAFGVNIGHEVINTVRSMKPAAVGGIEVGLRRVFHASLCHVRGRIFG